MNIFGARGRISNVDDTLGKISSMEKRHDSTIQLFRADRIFGREHLQTAAEMALRSWDRGTARARTLGMEIMLYASAERQISGAINKLGIGEGMTEFAIIIIGQICPENVIEAIGLERADIVLDPRDKDHGIFEISDGEKLFASIPDIVLERMALSELNR